MLSRFRDLKKYFNSRIKSSFTTTGAVGGWRWSSSLSSIITHPLDKIVLNLFAKYFQMWTLSLSHWAGECVAVAVCELDPHLWLWSIDQNYAFYTLQNHTVNKNVLWSSPLLFCTLWCHLIFCFTFFLLCKEHFALDCYWYQVLWSKYGRKVCH